MGKRKSKAPTGGAHRRAKCGRKGTPIQRSKTLWRWPLGIVAVAAIGLIGALIAGENESIDDGGAHLQVRVPDLSPMAQAGQAAFDEKCAQCHGRSAAGSKKGPPLVHRLYEPSHHANASFWRAVQKGVQAHHWNYGNMPRTGVSDSDMGTVIRYVRELQRANGIR